MKIYALILTLLAASLVVHACRIEPSSLVGDLPLRDVAIEFSAGGQIAIGQTSFGGSGFSIAFDVLTTSGTGCVFSGGSGSELIEVRMADRKVQLQVGSATASTFKVLPVNSWVHVVVTLDYSVSPPKVTVFLNGEEHEVDSKISGPLSLAGRSATIGRCADGSGLVGVIDNVMVFNDVRTMDEAFWSTIQFFPLVDTDNLVFYFTFNDVAIGSSTGTTRAFAGAAATSSVSGELLPGAKATKKSAATNGVFSIADEVCTFSGATYTSSTGGSPKLAPFYGTPNGGATQSVSCNFGTDTAFTVNEFWMPEGGIKQMTVKTSAYHYWRISAPGLKVEHRTWGGWSVLPRGADLIDFDGTTYKFTDSEVVIQSAIFGYVRITEDSGHLNYELGVNTEACPLTGAPARASWCDHVEIPEHIFDFSSEPVPEMPFGRKATEPGVAGSPPVLACPPPSTVYCPECRNCVDNYGDWSACSTSQCNVVGVRTRVSPATYVAANWWDGAKRDADDTRRMFFVDCAKRSGEKRCGGWWGNPVGAGGGNGQTVECEEKVQSENCMTPCPPPPPDPIPCSYNPWSGLGACSVSSAQCSGNGETLTGEAVRVRTTNAAQFGGAPCTEALVERLPCQVQCPRNCIYGEWTAWSGCPSCGGGVNTRSRAMDQPLNGGQPCTAPAVESVQCNNPPTCSCAWGPWGAWSSCSVSPCGSGIRTRYRTEDPGSGSPGQCTGTGSDSEACGSACPPPVGCSYNPWSAWSACSGGCPAAPRTRSRTVTPGAGGDVSGCPLTSENSACPDVCVCTYGEWSGWGACSKACGGGQTVRSRTATGDNCNGATQETQSCNEGPCGVDCTWGDWGAWSECSLKCGGGTQTTHRSQSPAQFGGKECDGAAFKTQDCNTQPCPVNCVFQEWSGWSGCSGSCQVYNREGLPTGAAPTTSRSRTFSPAAFGGAECVGETDQTLSCNTEPCPIDCQWTAWSNWDVCSVECGGGITWSYRKMLLEKYGGKPCTGESKRSMECNTMNCPLPPAPPPPTGSSEPCEPWRTGNAEARALYSQWTVACSARFTKDTPEHEKCMIDSCVTGSGPNVDPTGSYPCFRASAPGGDVHIIPVIVTDEKGNRLASDTQQFNGAVQETFKRYAVEDSIVVYVLQSRETDGSAAYHLAIMNSNGKGSDAGGSYRLTVSGAGAAVASTWGDGGGVATVGKEGENLVSLVTWGFNSRVGIFIKNLPSPYTGTVSLSDKAGNVAQLLIGSAHGSNAASGILSVFKSAKDSITITGDTCQNECTAIDNCADCSENTKCGWCVETASCMPGDASGPVAFGTCANWRYTFDADYSRRLTQEYAYPVSPGFTDVFLTSASSPHNTDLPLEVLTHVDEPETIVWDAVYLSVWDPLHKSSWQQLHPDLLSVMRTYPNMGVSFNRLSDSAAGFEVTKPLSNPRDNYWFGKLVESAPAVSLDQLPVMKAIIEICSTSYNTIGWRSGARKVLIITADKPFVKSHPVEQLRDTLASRDVIPVFVVTPDVAAQYKQLVADLGFGFTETLAARSTNIRQAAVRSIQLVAGQAAVFFGKAGHLDEGTWSEHSNAFRMYGLNRHFKARFSIPVHADAARPGVLETTLVMPAFGTARIENVKSDRPSAEAVPSRTSGLEGEDQIVELKGRSFRNLLETHPVITVLPKTGALYQVTTVIRNGAAVAVAGDLIEMTAPQVTDPHGRVAYRSPKGTVGSGVAQFTFVMNDGCVDSDPVVVMIDVINVNDPPKPDIMPPTGEEDKPQTLFLTATDTDKDAYDSIIVMPPHGLASDGSMIMNNRQGFLYQYNEAILISRENAAAVGERITGENVVVKDPAHRVIFWPADHTNSHADLGLTPDLLVKPCVDYKVVETKTTEKFESAVKKVPIDIRPVNDLPLVWGDTSADSSTYTYQWPAISDTITCWKHNVPCVFEEDLGEKYPWDAGFVFLYLGGGDVEKSQLIIEFTTIDCPADAVIQNDLVGSRNIAVGDLVLDNDPNQLHPIIRFRPGPDGNNQNAGTDGSYYCKIGYRLRDYDGGRSIKEHMLVLSVTPMPDDPRLDERETVATVVERVPELIPLSGVDPERSDVDVVVTECLPKGRLEVCADVGCVDTRHINCGFLPDEGFVLPGKTITVDPSFSGDYFTYRLVYTSDAVSSLAEGLRYNYVKVKFVEKKTGKEIGLRFTLNINVILINSPPSIAFGNVTDAVISAKTPGDTLRTKISIADQDIGFGDMDVAITLTPVQGVVLPKGEMSIDLSVFEASAILVEEPHKIVVRGKIDQINAALTKFTVKGEKFGKYELVVSANDNGYFGQCPDGARAFTGLLCPLEAKTTVHLEFVDTGLVNGLMISGAGIGVIVLSVVGVVGALRFFNKDGAAPGFAPWDEFDADGAAVNNPLFESGAIEMTSGIYQDGKGGGDYQAFRDSYL